MGTKSFKASANQSGGNRGGTEVLSPEEKYVESRGAKLKNKMTFRTNNDEGHKKSKEKRRHDIYFHGRYVIYELNDLCKHHILLLRGTIQLKNTMNIWWLFLQVHTKGSVA